VLLLFGRQLFVFVECHCLVVTQSIEPASLKALAHSSLPVVLGAKIGYLGRYVDQPPMPHAASIKPW
jgi:hypothetical protein